MSVELASNRTVLYGKDLNHVRGWYFWLRRQLGLKKAIGTIKKIEITRRGLQMTSYTNSHERLSIELRNRFVNSIRHTQRIAKQPREEEGGKKRKV